jgi:hypothetical protein
MVTDRPGNLSLQRFVLPGSWQMRDYTDKVCAMEYYANKPVYPPRTTFLIDLATGRRRLALGSPVNAVARFQILGVKISDHWIAWEEVSPGDDLIHSVRWALYAARYNPRTLSVGPATIIDSGTTRDPRNSASLAQGSGSNSGVSRSKGRPLFDFGGDTLCWMVNVTAGTYVDGGKSVGQVWAIDLGRHQPRLLYQTTNAIGTLNVSDSRAIVTEHGTSAVATGLISVLDLRTGQFLQQVALGMGYRLAHFPSARNGLLAWAVYSDECSDQMYPDLYLHDRRNTSHYVAFAGHDPCLVGDWLFFVRNPAEGSYGSQRRMAEVDVVNCTTNVGYVLAKGGVDAGGNWLGGFGAPATAQTFVAYNDKALGAGPGEPKVTLLDVYRVRVGSGRTAPGTAFSPPEAQ